MSNPPGRFRTITLIAAATMLFVAGCSSGDSDAKTDPSTTAGADATAVEAGTGTDSPGETVEVVAVDFGYENLPTELDAGTRLTMRNDADEELHELVAFRLDDDETRSVDELVQLPPDELMGVLGPDPAAVLLTPPGGDTIVPVGDGTLTDTGRYAVVCMIPTGADPDEYLAAAADSDGPPDVAGGPPHIAQGMYAEVTVR